MIVIGKHLATTEKFPTREAAEERINSIDWNLVTSMIYACKEADEYEKKTEKKINSIDWNLVTAMIYACKEADEYEKKLKRSAKKINNNNNKKED